MTRYLCAKQNKNLNKLNKNINLAKCKIAELEKRRGHYSKKNINKRDEIARKNLEKLRAI